MYARITPILTSLRQSLRLLESRRVIAMNKTVKLTRDGANQVIRGLYEQYGDNPIDWPKSARDRLTSLRVKAKKQTLSQGSFPFSNTGVKQYHD